MMYEGPVKDYLFETSCIKADGDDINEMRDHESCIYIPSSELFKACEDVDYWAHLMGYDDDFKLSDDQHVAYYRSKYRGKLCHYIVHSAIEYVWVRREDVSRPKVLADKARERMEEALPPRIHRAAAQVVSVAAEDLQKDMTASSNAKLVKRGGSFEPHDDLNRPEGLVHMGNGALTTIWVQQLYEALSNILTEISGLQQTSQGHPEDWETKGMGKMRLLEEWEWMKTRLGIPLWRQELGDPDIPKPKMDEESPFEPRRPKNPIVNWKDHHRLYTGDLVVREDGTHGTVMGIYQLEVPEYDIAWHDKNETVIDRRSKENFEPVYWCPKCKKFMPWSEGADDWHPDICDTCWSKDAAREEHVEKYGWKVFVDKEPLIYVSAYPDAQYPIRILEAHLSNNAGSYVTDNTHGAPPTNPALVAMNEASAERAEMLKQAIAILRRG